MIYTSIRRFPDRQQGSIHEPFTLQFLENGNPVDLSEETITFTIRNVADGDKPIDGEDASCDASGNFTYQPKDTELDDAGEYQAQIVVEYEDMTKTYLPPLDLRILANL